MIIQQKLNSSQENNYSNEWNSEQDEKIQVNHIERSP
jgi:hypothetical protein